MTCDEIMSRLESLRNPAAAAGMAKFGINTRNTLGVSLPDLRKLAKEAGKDHELALALWRLGSRDARILAALVDRPQKVTEEQMERWVVDFDSWDVCDGCCNHLFDRTEFAYRKAVEWSARDEEFVKRAGFVLIATRAVHDKTSSDAVFECFFPIIAREATDSRNMVKKAVNWALRQIGKRNLELRDGALRTAAAIHEMDSASARWIASDAMRELRSDAVRQRLLTVRK